MNISVSSISKSFKTDEVQTQSLNNVSLDIKQGQFVAVVGESGSGKSTLLNAIGLLDRVDSGQIYYGNEELSTYPFHKLHSFRANNLGFVFQNFNLLGGLSVLENVILPLRYAGVKKSDAIDKGLAVLEKLNIAHRVNHKPFQLSGGQQQRVAIARAIINEPSLLLADEPTGNLDSENGAQVMEILSELHQEGTTILMVTHSMSQTSQVDRVIKMQDGCIIEDSLSEDVSLQHASLKVSGA